MKVHVHFGLPKAGSTSIQSLYGEHNDPSVCFIGKSAKPINQFEDPSLQRLFRSDLLGLSEKQFDRQYGRAWLSDKISLSDFETYILSEELLSGIGFRTAFTRSIGFTEIIKRIENLFSDCDIYYHLVRRDPEAFLASYHRHLVVSNHYPFSKSTLQRYLRRAKPWFDGVVSGELPQNILGDRLRVQAFEQIIKEGFRWFHRPFCETPIPLPRLNTSEDRQQRSATKRLTKYGRRLKTCVAHARYLTM